MTAGVMGVPKAEREARTHRRFWTRVAFYAHLWLGVVVTIALVGISITGILLNHKRGLGLMPDVPHETTAPFSSSQSLDALATSALMAAPAEARGSWKQ